MKATLILGNGAVFHGQSIGCLLYTSRESEDAFFSDLSKINYA